MRKISIDSAKALVNGYKFNRDNTKVEISDNGKFAYMYLFENLIAIKNLETTNISINNCGYSTTTTKDRLNAIIRQSASCHDYVRIFQRDFSWFITKSRLIARTNNKVLPFESRFWFPLVGDDVIKDGNEENSQLKTVSMVSAMFGVMCGGDKSTANKYQKRFLNTIPGIDFPDNWDKLTEQEQTKRLDGAIKNGLNNGGIL